MKPHYYSQKYNDKFRWLNYWYQINEVLNLSPKNVLEIGAGNKTVNDYLRRSGINIASLDINSELKPDIVGSVTNLKMFKDEEFDVVLCAQVLEHLPFEEFQKSINEIKRVTKSMVLSLPQCGPYFKFNYHIPLIGEKTFILKISGVNKNKFSGEHYWEIGERGYSLKKIITIIENMNLKISKTFLTKERPFQRFFIINKNNK
jgi:ubiquinone/menaquinone biosynthesis C-methylase UbiE